MYRTWTFSFKWPKGKCYPPIYTLMFLSSHFLGWMNQLKVEVISEGIFNLFLSSTHQIKKTVLKLFNEKEKSMDSILVQFYKDGSKLNIPFKITPPLINPIVIHMHFDDFLQKKNTQATSHHQNNHGRFNKHYLSFFRDSPCVSIQDLRENLFRDKFENSKTQSGSSKSMMGSSDSVRQISQWLVCIIKNFVCQTLHRRVVTFYPITKNWPNMKKSYK